MFVQYSFIDKHDHPGFKSEPIRLGNLSVVVIGIVAMYLVSTAYLLCSY